MSIGVPDTELFHKPHVHYGNYVVSSSVRVSFADVPQSSRTSVQRDKRSWSIAFTIDMCLRFLLHYRSMEVEVSPATTPYIVVWLKILTLRVRISQAKRQINVSINHIWVFEHVRSDSSHYLQVIA
jgi:hypothetical protein